MTYRSFARLTALLAAATILLSAAAVLRPALAQDGQDPRNATIVGAAAVNIRECPKLSCKVAVVAELGTPVSVTGEPVDGFVPVELGGKAGFVYYLYVAVEGQDTPQLLAGEPGCKRVALIFNVGIGYETQLDILDRLKAEKVPATIFPMGWWAEEFSDDLKQMVKGGFVIGSHGDDRLELTDRSDDEVAQDVRDSFRAIERAGGAKPEPYFTPYAADMDERVRGIVARAGYLPVFWEVSAQDYGPDVTSMNVYENVMYNIYDGAIVELHLDGPATAASTGTALPWIVAELRDAGYTFVTIPEMARPCEDPAERGTPQADRETPEAGSGG